ncbi:MAG TPA: hypothetical protein VII47_13115 [Actinomycetota bacterium]|jgi:hypothetical protein
MSITIESPRVDLGPNIPISELVCVPEAGSGALWMRECPCCGRFCEAELDACIDDGTSLRKVGISLPFIWIG